MSRNDTMVMRSIEELDGWMSLRVTWYEVWSRQRLEIKKIRQQEYLPTTWPKRLRILERIGKVTLVTLYSIRREERSRHIFSDLAFLMRFPLSGNVGFRCLFLLPTCVRPSSQSSSPRVSQRSRRVSQWAKVSQWHRRVSQ